MKFTEKYQIEKTWHGKVRVMEIFHLAMCHKIKGWTITRTAKYFDCSIGLVSENLKLAQRLHKDEKLAQCLSRQEALKKVR